MNLNPNYILQVRGLCKSFSGVVALNNVQLDLRRGEVHALMGENGAGKSTFMKIIMGLLPADAGEVVFEGNVLKNSSVQQNLKKGIVLIHQEILAVPELSVAQNIFLGRETNNFWGWLNDADINQKATQLLAQMGLNIAATTPMKHLSVAQTQMVEIAKAIANDAKVLIMDEPTSAISDKEVAMLFGIIKDLKNKGVAIVYISHKMDEIYQIADAITVLRDGQYITTKSAHELNQNALIACMVGREITQLFPEFTAKKGEIVLSVRHLSRRGQFADVNFDLRAGEVLGVAGLMGAGRTEIARVLFGLDQADAGEIWIKNQKVRIKSPQDAFKNGIGYVSEDRKGWGFVPKMSVKHNLSLASLRRHTKNGWVKKASENTATAKAIKDLQIKASSPDQAVMYLSGGNQQKVVIGKVLLAKPNVVILDEPTRGVDVGAKFEIYKLISALTHNGIAVVLISSELPEILGMSDRILVLAKGKQTALLSKQEATQETIMQYAVQ